MSFGHKYIPRDAIWIAATLLVGTMMSSVAAAQYEEESLDTRSLDINSSERVQVSIKGGPYEPDGGNAFEQVFDGELGPLIAFEFNVFIYRLEGIGALGVASGLGWADYGAAATVSGGSTVQVTETTDLTLFPVPVLATVRIDALARQWNIPFVVTGKLGPDFVFWTASTGGATDAENVSIGLHWAIELALELDWFDRRAMRSLDDEWGINHALIFAELFGTTASSTLPVGPDAGWALRGGLGLVF